MKLSKKQNPYDVAVGQIWKRRGNSRPNQFVIIRFEKAVNGIMAVAEYGKGKLVHHSMINLLNFNRYVKVK